MKVYFDEYIHFPRTEAELLKVTTVYEKLGFPGCVGSVDCTPVGLSNMCKCKEGKPTLVYEVVVDHSRKILSTTRHFYGTRNDKTIS